MRIQQGVPDPVRGFVWKAMAAARSPMGFRKHGLYQQLLEQVHTGPDPAGSRLGAAFEQVDKDVPRTMTGHIYFRSRDRIGQKALTRVLKAYAVFDPTLGYTQGMSSYAAVLLLYMREVRITESALRLLVHTATLIVFISRADTHPTNPDSSERLPLFCPVAPAGGAHHPVYSPTDSSAFARCNLGHLQQPSNQPHS
jgi:hypothetical protein